MKDALIYIHGKGGNARECEHYVPLFEDRDVIGFDYKAQTPWEAVEEFPRFFDAVAQTHGSVAVIANSIGAYFTLHALAGRKIERAYLISPVADMTRLILDIIKLNVYTVHWRVLRVAAWIQSSKPGADRSLG